MNNTVVSLYIPGFHRDRPTAWAANLEGIPSSVHLQAIAIFVCDLAVKHPICKDGSALDDIAVDKPD